MTPKEEAVYCLINVMGQYVNNPINRLVKSLESRSKLPINKLKSQFECDLCNKIIFISAFRVNELYGLDYIHSKSYEDVIIKESKAYGYSDNSTRSLIGKSLRTKYLPESTLNNFDKSTIAVRKLCYSDVSNIKYNTEDKNDDLVEFLCAYVLTCFINKVPKKVMKLYVEYFVLAFKLGVTIDWVVKLATLKGLISVNERTLNSNSKFTIKIIYHTLNFELFNKNYSIPVLSQYVSDIKFFIEEKCILRNSNIHLLGGVNELRWYAHNLISGKLSSYDAKVINYSNMIDYTLSLPYHSHNSRVLSAGLPNLAIYFHSISDGVLSKTQIEDITALGIWPEHFDGKNICIVLTGTNNSSKSKYIENKIRHQVENYCLLFEVKFLTLSENNTSEGCHKYELDGLVSLARNFCIETKAESSEDSIGLSTVFLDRHKYRYLLKELPLEEKINYLLMLANFIPGRTSSTIRDIHDFLTLIGYYMEIDESAVEHVLDVIDSDEGLGISFTNKHKGSNLMSIFLFDALAGLAHCSDDKKRIITIVESALSNN